MGTHPIFESDFDCLTDMGKRKNVSFGGAQIKEIPNKADLPPPTEHIQKPPVDDDDQKAFRKNNRVIENNDFNFGTGDQRSDGQTFVNEKGSRMKTGVNAIDSDDEEENAKQDKKMAYKKLDLKKVNGLEDDPDCGQMDQEGNMITGFNLKDELEEGEFDSTGQFHFKKGKRDDQDEWLDSLDWKAIKKNEQKTQEQMDSAENKPDEPERDEKEILSEILKIVKPKETVTKALQRLGQGGQASGKLPAWKQKRLDALKRKKGKNAPVASETGGDDDKKALNLLTELVDKLSQKGYYEIYADPYEKIAFKLKQLNETSKDDDMDIFGDEPSAKKMKADDDVTWEYKESQDGDLIGPCSTSKMLKLQAGDNKDLLVRRVNTGNFYNIKRVDFDLYD